MSFTQPFILSGLSMYPTLREGDKIFLEEIAPVTLKVGDLLMFQNPKNQTPCLHRLLCVGKAHVLTAGDAHWRVDSAVPFVNVLGRVSNVEPGNQRPPFVEPEKNLLHCILRRIHFMVKKGMLMFKENDSVLARRLYSVLSAYWTKRFIQRRALK